MNNFKLKIFDKFDELLAESNSRIAVGVSGGADSLALVILAKEWADKNDKEVIAITVDHNLRKESAKEAWQVGKWLDKYEISHVVLKWEHEKEIKNIEEDARFARYELIEEFTVNEGIEDVLIGHHKNDQAETFLMRLQRGSGIDGLSCMSEKSKRGSINLIRPLLGFNREEIQEYLTSINQEWVEDPHNESDDFLRVRVRKILPILEKELGLSIEVLSDTASHMQRARNYFDDKVAKIFKNNVKIDEFGFITIAPKLIKDLDDELGFRLLVKIFNIVSGGIYPPRFKRLERFFSDIKNENQFNKQTFAGCNVFYKSGVYHFVREIANIKSARIVANKMIFDNRISLYFNDGFEDCEVSILGDSGWKYMTSLNSKYKNIKLDYDRKVNLVCVKKKNKIIEVPYLEYCDGKEVIKEIKIVSSC